MSPLLENILGWFIVILCASIFIVHVRYIINFWIDKRKERKSASNPEKK